MKIFVFIFFTLIYCSTFSQINAEKQINLNGYTYTLTIKKDTSVALPDSVGSVNDFENVFSTDEIKKLDSLIFSYDTNHHIQFCIVTLDSSLTTLENFNSYVLNLMNLWKIGANENNMGITIGISVHYRKIRICNGYGIESILTDEETKKIMNDHFIFNFKTGNYFKGTWEGLNKLMETLLSRI